MTCYNFLNHYVAAHGGAPLTIPHLYNHAMLTFVERLQRPEPLLIDGATGTELARRGLDTGTPIWSALALIEAPHIVEQVHADYLAAGAEVILTNTFRTHRRNLERLGLGDQAARLTALAVAIAQKAVANHKQETLENAKRSPSPAKGQAFVAGSISPLEDSYSPELTLSHDIYLAEHGEMAANLAAAGVDLLLAETMNTVAESAAAAQAAADTGLPFGVSWVCRDDGHLLSGESIAEAVAAVAPWGPAFLAINCTPAPVVSPALQALQAASNLPLGVYANIGHTDTVEHWQHTEDLTPDEYAACAADWLGQGLKLVGGCCNTTPAHIAALRAHVPAR
jgi:homocysteine S-methyltransferase